jgi:hypothetical protein
VCCLPFEAKLARDDAQPWDSLNDTLSYPIGKPKRKQRRVVQKSGKFPIFRAND